MKSFSLHFTSFTVTFVNEKSAFSLAHFTTCLHFSGFGPHERVFFSEKSDPGATCWGMECQWGEERQKKFRSPWLDGFRLVVVSFDGFTFHHSLMRRWRGSKKHYSGEEKHVNRILKRNQQKLWSRMSKLFPISSFSPFWDSLMEWWMVNRANLCVTHRKTIKINKTTNQAIRLSVALISTSLVISSNQDPKATLD